MAKHSNLAYVQIIVVAHCYLNPTVRLKGHVKRGLAGAPTESEHMGRLPGIGGENLIQLPCPEAIYFGVHRWELTKNQLDFSAYRRFCRKIFEPYADILGALAREGAEIKILGVAKSPSCAAETTTIGYPGGRVKETTHEHIKAMGVFFEEIKSELEKRGIKAEYYDAY